jgi:hypothetical protein
MTHDPKRAAHPHEAPAAGGKGRSIDHIQADLEDVLAQLHEAIPEIESDSLKAHRQLERIEAAKTKWRLTHEPDDPFDPKQFEPPMVPLKIDPAKQRAFHGLHYRVAKLEGELAAALKGALATE